MLRKKTANHFINFDILAVTLWIRGEPTTLPVPDDAETVRVRMYGMSHTNNYARVIFTQLFLRRMSEARPKARGIYFFNMPALSTTIDCILRASTSSPDTFAFATALLMSFIMGSAARFGRNSSAVR